MIGNRIIQLESIDSTNNYAVSLTGSDRPEEGTVVWAREQTAGRGQGNNRWQSEPGRNLTFTIILYPAWLSPENQFLLNKAIALGVLGFVSEYADHASIKWPNDICIGTRKVSGILIENRLRGSWFDSSIVGIGINLNQTGFDPGLPNAISLAQLIHRELDPAEALQGVCKSIDLQWEQLIAGEFARISNNYNTSLLFYNTLALFTKQNERFTGTVTGVDDQGRLMIRDTGRRLLRFAHKEVEYVTGT